MNNLPVTPYILTDSRSLTEPAKTMFVAVSYTHLRAHETSV